MSVPGLRIGNLLLATSLIAVGSCQERAPPLKPEPHPPTEYRSASGEVSSWGIPVRRWRVDHDGRAEIITNEFLGRGEETTVIFNLDLGQKARLRSLLQAAAAYKGHRIECKGSNSDPPYGNIRLETSTGSDVIHFIGDCPSVAMQKVEESEQVIYDFLGRASGGGTRIVRTITHKRTR